MNALTKAGSDQPWPAATLAQALAFPKQQHSNVFLHFLPGNAGQYDVGPQGAFSCTLGLDDLQPISEHCISLVQTALLVQDLGG